MLSISSINQKEKRNFVIISFLQYILNNGEIELNAAVEKFGVSSRMIRRYAETLIKTNLIIKVQPGYKDKPIYRLNEKFLISLLKKVRKGEKNERNDDNA